MGGGGGGLEQIGVEALFLLEGFMQGLNTYNSGLDEANSKTDTSAKAMQAALENFDTKANTALNAVVDGFQGLSAVSIAVATTIGNVLADAIGKAIDWVVNLGKEGLTSAARVQELDYVLQILAPRANTTIDALRGTVEEIKNLGIQTDVAQNLVQQFIRYQLDLGDATKLARVAQDTAVISMKDSSSELQSLLWGIQTYNTRIFRTAGLNIDMSDAMDKYAKTIGKTRETLNQTEKQQAALNAVLEEGARNAGMYEAAMEAPGKQLRSFQRDIYELGVAMGEPFLVAFANVISMLRDTAKAFIKAMEDGGPLHEFLVNLGGAAALATEYLKTFVSQVVTGFLGILSGTVDFGAQFNKLFNDIFGITVDSAIQWGEGIIQALADGMASAEQAVVDVLISIGELIASWLQPGSPPKITPNLDKWGAAAMTTYIQGWAQGDFSSFKDISGVLESYLRSLGKSVIPEEGLLPMIMGGREGIAAAMDKMNAAGAVTDDVLATLFAHMGPVSQAVKDYSKSVLEMELITSQMSAVQKELNDLQNAAAQDAVTDRLKHINDALATGKLTTEEQTKLEREKRVITLQSQLDTLGGQKTALQAQMDMQRSTIDMQTQQNKLVSDQIALLDRLAKAAAFGGGGGGTDLSGLNLGAGIPAISDKMKAEVEAAKEKIKLAIDGLIMDLGKKWDKLKQDFTDKFITPIQGKLTELQKVWGPIWTEISRWAVQAWTDIKKFWDESIQPIIEKVTKFAQDHPGDLLKIVGGLAAIGLALAVISPLISGIIPGAISLAGSLSPIVSTLILIAVNWSTIAAIAGVVLGFISETVLPVIIILGVLAAFVLEIGIVIGVTALSWKNNWFGIRDAVEKVWAKLTDFWNFLVISFKPTWDAIVAVGQSLYDLYLAIGDLINAVVSKAFEWLKATVALLIEKIISLLEWLGEKTGLTKVLKDNKDKIDAVKLALQTLGTHISTVFTDAIKGIVGWLNDKLVAAFEGVKGAIDSVVGFLQRLADAIRNLPKLPSWITPGSPTPFETGLRGIADALQQVNAASSGLDKFGSGALGPNQSMIRNASTSNVYNKTIQVNMNPSYQTVQSPSSIYYDIEAALASARI